MIRTPPFPAFALLAALAAVPAEAQDAPGPPRIVVTGEGEAALKPDLAVLSLGTLSEAATAAEALDANARTMAAVVAAVKAAGVADRDVQTAGIQISPRYEYAERSDGTQEGRLVAYQVTNTVAVRVRAIERTGEIIDKAVAEGANNGGGISFSNDDPKPALAEARRRAVADAVEKARTLAEAAGVGLGRVTEISDTVSASPPVPMMLKAAGAARDATPVEAGENSYSVQVNMTFELK
jgi:uncharacterized protein